MYVFEHPSQVQWYRDLRLTGFLGADSRCLEGLAGIGTGWLVEAEGEAEAEEGVRPACIPLAPEKGAVAPVVPLDMFSCSSAGPLCRYALLLPLQAVDASGDARSSEELSLLVVGRAPLAVWDTVIRTILPLTILTVETSLSCRVDVCWRAPPRLRLPRAEAVDMSMATLAVGNLLPAGMGGSG